MNQFRTYKQDKQNGEESELKHKNIFNTFFNDKFNKLSTFHPLDFEGDKFFLEVKTRTNNYNKYPTSLISASKINFCKKQNKETYFIFVFTDDIYYIKYDDKLFKTFDIKPFKRSDRIDHTDKLQNYYYIPIENLSKLII
jgi:hypothetical protein